jgi:DMSO/TMAO reductase YedYZ molybdopterin-dependent catalytic subunit
LIPEFRIRFTGLIEVETEMSYRDIVQRYSENVEARVLHGTRTDDEEIAVEYTGIQLLELIKDVKIDKRVEKVIIYGNDKYAAVLPVSDLLNGKVYFVWKKEGRYMVPSQDGFFKIVQDRGLTKNWVKNPVVFDFVSGFYDKVPLADRLNSNEIDFISQQDMFTLALGSAPKIEDLKYTLKIRGLILNPKEYSYGDIQNMPQISVYATLETISNPPGGRLIGNAIWTGIPLSYIFNQVNPTSNAQEVVFYCYDGYSTSITLEEAQEEGVILAFQMNGATLEPEQGYPVRVVVPEKYGQKWAKWIKEIEFVDYDYRGYWESRGWSDYAGRDRPDKRYD